MLEAYEQKSAKDENRPLLLLGLIFIAAALVMLCILSILYLNGRRASRTTPQPELPLVVPAVSPAVVPPVVLSSVRLPVILSGSGAQPLSAAPQIWEVTKIKLFGYEQDGQHFDMATFRRLNTQDTAKGYCINRGWDTPAIGAQYTLDAKGVFTPLQEPVDDPLQRFQLIQ